MSRRIIITALVLAIAATTAAAQVGGVTLADSVRVDGKALVLNGAGLREKMFVDVYVGGLYLPARQTAAPAILGSDTPRRMVMHFVHKVGASQIAEAWQEGLAANTPNAPADIQGAFKTLGSWMEDMAPGDELALTYVPGAGTTVEVKGRTRGTLGGGKPVADAILATWIGPRPGPGNAFKKGVLGQ
jgi:hypothetical protein